MESGAKLTGVIHNLIDIRVVLDEAKHLNAWLLYQDATETVHVGRIPFENRDAIAERTSGDRLGRWRSWWEGRTLDCPACSHTARTNGPCRRAARDP